MAYFVFDLNWPSMTVGLLCSVQGHSQKGGGLDFPHYFSMHLGAPRAKGPPTHHLHTDTPHHLHTDTLLTLLLGKLFTNVCLCHQAV